MRSITDYTRIIHKESRKLTVNLYSFSSEDSSSFPDRNTVIK